MRNLRVVLAGVGLTVMLAACGNGPPPDTSATSAATPGPVVGTVVTAPTTVAAKVIANDTLKFTPATTTVKAGGVVEWSNTGTAPHTITFADPYGSLTDPSFGSGKTYAVQFTVAGKYSYKCTIHPGMVGEIDVT
jgi:plastocyanin